MRGEDAEAILNDALRSARNANTPTALKIIHGHGGGGTLKQTVLNWTYRNRTRLRAVIPGERYSITDRETAAMRLACGQESDADMGQANHGMTIIWIDNQ
jgi:hypothetical protein